MFLREQQGLELAGAAGGRSFGRALVPVADVSAFDRIRARAVTTDWVPDLGAQIGSLTWWRGLFTCVALCGSAWLLSPGFHPLAGAVAAPVAGAEWEETRTQSIAPIALGSTTGRRLAASDLVRPLAETPDRPSIDLSAAIGDGDTLGDALQRAGVSRNDAAQAVSLVSNEVHAAAIPTGTVLDMTLGRRATRRQPRPLDRLALRAAFDLNVTITRAGDALSLTRQPIAIDRTPLHIRGLVGPSLYRSARAAGAPAKMVEAYIKAVAAKVSIGDVGADDTFDMVADQARAATGDVEVGQLQYAGLEQGSRKLRLVRWKAGEGGDTQFWDLDGQYETRGTMALPVAGHVTSTFGYRMHPILGFMRMHKGMDIGAPYGSPIFASADGVVAFAGRNSGYGNFVKLNHGDGLATGYGHMSRIAVSPGTRVRRGQVIGYVGSTGLSTGPHVHWEVWKNGASVNPRSITWRSVATLSAATLRTLKARMAALIAVAAR